MGGGSLGFVGSVASFWAALLKAYCEEIQHNNDQMVFLLSFFTTNLNR